MMRLIVTDSGLGGLAVCAALERALAGARRAPRLTYVNAWPETGRGYNDLPDMAARASAFDRALDAMAARQPDLILIACNTLSIVYEHTRFQLSAPVPVLGIVDGGVALFREAIDAHPGSGLMIIGTRTTVESGVHRARLIRLGVAPDRIGGESCHGLATAIERGPDSARTAELIATCADRAAEAAPPGEPIFLGLACTHYGMVAGRLAGALAARIGRRVVPLDPNARLVDDVVARISGLAPEGGTPAVDVISKVELPEEQRESVARLLDPISTRTAAALRAYALVPDLF